MTMADKPALRVAVLGCGHDIDYPQRNRSLRRAIEAIGTFESIQGASGNTLKFTAENHQGLRGDNDRIVLVFTPRMNEMLGGALFAVSTNCDLMSRNQWASSNVGEYFYAQVPTSTAATSPRCC